MPYLVECTLYVQEDGERASIQVGTFGGISMKFKDRIYGGPLGTETKLFGGEQVVEF